LLSDAYTRGANIEIEFFEYLSIETSLEHRKGDIGFTLLGGERVYNIEYRIIVTFGLEVFKVETLYSDGQILSTVEVAYKPDAFSDL
jgi:hypothetical protein